MANKQCIHYWILDNKDVGRCRYCGAVKDFGVLLRKFERLSQPLSIRNDHLFPMRTRYGRKERE